MGRKIGARITQVAEIIGRLGSCTAKQIGEHMPGIVIQNVHKCASRAVYFRLVSVDRTVRPKIYRVVDKSVSKPEPESERASETQHLQGVWR